MGLFDGIDVDKKLQESKERADKHFSGKEKALFTIDDSIKEKICKSKEDEELLIELINGLKKATSLEEQENHIADNIKKFGGIVVKIIDAIAI